jgi:hypothetical protein
MRLPVPIEHSDVLALHEEVQWMARELSEVYDDLKPSGKAAALCLGHGLSRLSARLRNNERKARYGRNGIFEDGEGI